jgi:thiol:disulfide interchange protein
MKTRRMRYDSFPRQSLVIMTLFAGTMILVSMLPWFNSMAVKMGVAAPPGHILWHTHWRNAEQNGKKTGRLLLLDFQASWCPPCRLMDRTVWTDRNVARLVKRHFIAVREDIDSPDGKAAARKLGVEVLPTILVLDGQGNIINVAQSMGARQTRRFLRRSLAHAQAIQKVQP